MLYLLVSIWFQVLFHSPPGVLFTFPSRYYTLSVTRSYLALGDGPPIFPPDSSCPVVLWIPTRFCKFNVRDCHPLWSNFPVVFYYLHLSIIGSFTLSHITMLSLGSSPFARHYSENRLFSFFSSGYLDVSVPRVPLLKLCIHFNISISLLIGFPIRTSTD